MDNPTAFVIAIAVILSAIVSLIGTGARKQAVLEGRARASDLCELTGILEPRALQDIFGPPTIDGTYQVKLDTVLQARVPLGRLISDDRLDQASIGIGILAMAWGNPVVQIFLFAAALYQIAGWVVSNRLPGRS